MADLQLLSNASATGTAVTWKGGKGVFTLYSATIGGATVTLQWSPDGGTTWLAVDQGGTTFVTFTAVGAGAFELPTCPIRALVAAGTPSALYAKAIPLP